MPFLDRDQHRCGPRYSIERSPVVLLILLQGPPQLLNLMVPRDDE
jgi:hypothetical protein